MALEYQNPTGRAGYGYAAADAVGFDAGLRAYMLRVYNLMGFGLLLTAAVAWAFGANESLSSVLYTVGPRGGLNPTGLGWVVTFAPLGMLLLAQFALKNMGAAAAQLFYWIFTALMGASLSYIFLVYAGGTIFSAFAVTSVAFLGLSLFGYTTKRSLSGVGSFAMMALIGVIVASLVNIFTQSSGLAMILNYAVVLIFAALTAYDTQALKRQYAMLRSDGVREVSAVWGALSLYLNFINMFQAILSIMGSSRDD